MTIRYFDSGVGGPGDCLGRWLDAELVDGLRSFRGQFGYFDFSALRKYMPVLQGMVEGGGAFRLVIGANHGDPASEDDINELIPLIAGGGDAKLAIIGLSNALFHPKTIHLTRADQSLVGVIGSANLTSKGLGHNIEAGVVIESTEVTQEAIQRISSAIEHWFGCDDEGVHEITAEQDVLTLKEMGLIVSPATRRRLRSTNRSRGTVLGRGARAFGWRPPHRSLVDEPTEVEGSEPQDEAAVVERAGIAMRWCKKLRASDAQQVQPGTNPTGKLRLAKARFPINQTTYFREEFFADSNWIEVIRRGTVYEEVHVRFFVNRTGHEPVVETLRVDHATHRVADQNNVPTVLGWGSRIGLWLRENNQIENWVLLEKDINGSYWMSFQAEKPSWAP